MNLRKLIHRYSIKLVVTMLVVNFITPLGLSSEESIKKSSYKQNRIKATKKLKHNDEERQSKKELLTLKHKDANRTNGNKYFLLDKNAYFTGKRTPAIFNFLKCCIYIALRTLTAPVLEGIHLAGNDKLYENILSELGTIAAFSALIISFASTLIIAIPLAPITILAV